MSCFQNKPPLERLRVLCISCLVLDCLFVFIYSILALSYSSRGPKTVCYEEHHYIWHDIVAGSLMISAFIAVGGAITHSQISCNTSNTEQHFISVSRYAHSLVCWTFIQAVLEAIALGQEPAECALLDPSLNRQHAQSADHSVDSMHPEDRVLVIYQVTSTMMWLCWVTGCVAAGVLARRSIPLLAEACSPAPDSENPPSAVTPQTVGSPVTTLPSGIIAVTGAAQAGTADMGNFGGSEAPVAAGGGIVAQGRPVAGAECTKGGAASASGKS